MDDTKKYRYPEQEDNQAKRNEIIGSMVSYDSEIERAMIEYARYIVAKTEINNIKKEIVRLIYIHRQLEREWTGISLGRKKESINPHTERVEVLLEVLSFIGD